jgi:hypothetical protein
VRLLNAEDTVSFEETSSALKKNLLVGSRLCHIRFVYELKDRFLNVLNSGFFLEEHTPLFAIFSSGVAVIPSNPFDATASSFLLVNVGCVEFGDSFLIEIDHCRHPVPWCDQILDHQIAMSLREIR